MLRITKDSPCVTFLMESPSHFASWSLHAIENHHQRMHANHELDRGSQHFPENNEIRGAVLQEWLRRTGSRNNDIVPLGSTEEKKIGGQNLLKNISG